MSDWWENAPLASTENDSWWKMAPMDKPAKKIPGEDTARAVADGVNTGVNWLGTQFTKGITGLLGAPAALGDLGQKGAEWVGQKVGAPETGARFGQEFKRNVTLGGVLPNSEQLNQTVFGRFGVPEVNAADAPALTLTNPLGIPGKVNLGSMLDAGAQAIPGAMMLPAGPAANALSPGARAATTAIPAFTGGVLSDAGGQAAKDTPWEIPARFVLGSLGYMAGGRLVTPLPANLTPQQQANVDAARAHNIPMTVGQETGRGREIERALSRFPTGEGPFSRFRDRQQQAINSTTMEMTGQAAPRVDPATIDDAFTRLGNEFNRLSNGQNVTLGPNFYNRMGRAAIAYTDDTLPGDWSPAVTRRVRDFMNMQQQGGGAPVLTSQQYQSIRSDISKAAADAENSKVRRALREMRGALDDAMGASLPPAEAQAWQTAREQYGNLKIIAKASAAGTQESRAQGNLSPGALTVADRAARGTDQYARGQSPFAGISRAGDYLADSRPNSYTPTTTAWQNLLTGGAFTSPLAIAGYAVGGPVGAAVGAGAGVIAPNLMARAMTGQGFPGAATIRNYLANQAAVQAGIPRLRIEDMPYLLAPGVAVSAPRLENRR